MIIRTAAVILFVLLAVSCMIAQPKIKVIPGATLDMGDVYQGQKADKIISITNSGNDSLRITEVKAQCGCTATLLSRKIVGPADTSNLAISFDTRNYNGPVTKQVYISSNDSTTPKLTVQFTANVISVLNASPQMYSFENTKVDSTYKKEITLTNPSKKTTVKILAVEPKFEEIKAVLMKGELKPGEQTQLEVTFQPKKSGSYSGSIELITDNPHQPKFVIKIFTWVNRK